MLKRTALKRSMKPIPERRAKLRRGPMRCPEYRAWLRHQHCCVCLGIARTDATKVDFYKCTPVDPAHTQNNGMRSKGPDASCAPLCRVHHDEYDAGRNVFEQKYRINMKLEAAVHWATYLLEAV